MASFRHDGVDLHFELCGSGTRVLFFNGSGATIEGSRILIDRIAQRCTVLVHDQRGLGATGHVVGSAYSMAQYASDGAALLDHVGWGSAAVCGISFGGMVALEFAVTWPERVSRLALLCTSAGGAGGSSYPLHEMASLSDTQRTAVMAQLIDSRFTPEWLAEHDRDRLIMSARPSSTTRSATAAAGEAAQLEARRHHDVWDRLGAINAPTFIGAGRFDQIAPLANSEALASGIDASVLRVYDGGHAFMFQDRRALSDLWEFLEV